MSEAQSNAADLEVQLDGVNGKVDGLYVIYGDNESDISASDFEVADKFDEWTDDTRLTVFENQDLDDGNVIVICLEGTDGDTYYAAYEIVVD